MAAVPLVTPLPTIVQVQWKTVGNHSLFDPEMMNLLVVLQWILGVIREISPRTLKMLDISPRLVPQRINNECPNPVKLSTRKVNLPTLKVSKVNPPIPRSNRRTPKDSLSIHKDNHRTHKVNKLSVFLSPLSHVPTTTNVHLREINRNHQDPHERLYLPQWK